MKHILSFFLLPFFISSLNASDLDDYERTQIKNLNRELRLANEELKKIEKNKEEVISKLDILSSKLATNKKLILALEKQKREIKNNIDKLRIEIKGVEGKIESTKKNISKSNMYIIDSMGFAQMQVITSSGNAENIVSTLEILGNASANLKKAVDRLNSDILELRFLKETEQASLEEQEALIETEKLAQAELNEDKKKYKNLITLANNDKLAKKEYIELLRFQRLELENEIRQRAEEARRLQEEDAGNISEEKSPSAEVRGPNGRKIKTFGEDKPILESMADGSYFGKLAGSLPKPMEGELLESYGDYIVPDSGVRIFHQGIKLSNGKPSSIVKLVADGKVVYADIVRNFNNLIIVSHEEAFYTVYANLSKVDIEVGDILSSGARLGEISSEDGLTPYLYFEIRKNNLALNPELWFEK